MALTVNITKLPTPYIPYKAAPIRTVAPVSVATSARDSKGRFASALPTPKKVAARTHAPYRINVVGDVYPINGGSKLANVWSPKLKDAMLKAGLVV